MSASTPLWKCILMGAGIGLGAVVLAVVFASLGFPYLTYVFGALSFPLSFLFLGEIPHGDNVMIVMFTGPLTAILLGGIIGYFISLKKRN